MPQIRASTESAERLGKKALYEAERRRLRLPRYVTALFKQDDAGKPLLDTAGRPVVDTYKVQLTMPDGHQEARKRTTLPEAKQALQELFDMRATWKREVREGKRRRDGTPVAGGMLLGEVIRRYLTDRKRKPQSQPVTFRHVPQWLRDRPVGTITGDDLQELYDSIPTDHLEADGTPRRDALGRRLRPAGSSTVQRLHMDLASAFNHARKNRWMVDPLPTSQVERPEHDPKELRAWDFEETARFEHHIERVVAGEARTNNLYPTLGIQVLVAILLQLGPRIGELLAARWRDVDWTRRTLHLEGTIVLFDGIHRQNGLKTQPEGRLVSLPAGVFRLLRGWRDFLLEFGPQLGWPPPDGDALIFPALRSRHLFWQENHVATTLQRLMRDADVRVLRLHELRATCISHLLEARVNTVVIAALVGPESPEQIDRTYGKLLPSRRTAAAEAMDALRASFSHLADPVGVVPQFLAAAEALQQTLRLQPEAREEVVPSLIRNATRLQEAALILVADLPVDHPLLGRVDSAAGMIVRLRHSLKRGAPTPAPTRPAASERWVPPPFILPPTLIDGQGLVDA